MRSHEHPLSLIARSSQPPFHPCFCPLQFARARWEREENIEGESLSSGENREVTIDGGQLQERRDQRQRVRDHLAAGRQPH